MNILSRRITGVYITSSINADNGILFNLFPKKYFLRFLLFLISFCFIEFPSFSQCPPNPSLTLSSNSFSITVDDFSELSNDITFSTYLSVTAPAAGCEWDIFSHLVSFTGTAYSVQGTALAETDVEIRVVNVCETPNYSSYLGGPQPPCLADRICGSYSAPLDLVNDDYIVGTSAVDGVLLKDVAPCIATQINGQGNPSLNPTTHRFRIDFRISLAGIAPFAQPGLYDLQMEFNCAVDGFAPIDTKPFRIEIDVQPILQLKMSTSSQIDFTFSDVKEYNAGIVKYGATILEISSSLEWDLMAIGTSTDNESSGGANYFWDNPVSYSACVPPNNQIPLEVLELHQTPANPSGSGADIDYSSAFASPPDFDPPAGDAGLGPLGPGNNNIEVGIFPYAPGDFSTGAFKTIAGNWGDNSGPPANAMDPGSYQIPPNTAWDAGYRYVIDYRIVPSLPVTFGGFMANYACPGLYTMQVKYILAEDQ